MLKYKKIKELIEQEGKNRFWSLSKYEDWTEDILSHACGFVLDLGCGDGVYSREIAKRHLKTVSADLSEMKLRALRGLSNSYLVACSASEIPFKNNVFDTVLFLEVLEHLPSHLMQYQTFKDIKRVLKHGGRLILSTPNKPIYRLMTKMWYVLRGQKPDSTHFTELNYRQLLFIVRKYFEIIYQRGKFGLLKNKRFQRMIGKFPKVCYDILLVCKK
ncbi:MAG: class I SAM-dependent methyltransferase [Candidatus Edwardsbacteria bacterium]